MNKGRYIDFAVSIGYTARIMGAREVVGIFGGPFVNITYQRMFLGDSNHRVVTDRRATDPAKISEAIDAAVGEGMTVAVINHMEEGQDGKIDEAAIVEEINTKAPDVTKVIFSNSPPTESPKGDMHFKREGSPDDFPYFARYITKIPRP